jgi:tetratricopeptide (TPR) repeat protein
MGWALDMDTRFYERGSLRRGASCVLCAVLSFMPAGCGPAEQPPAKAAGPDSKQIDAAMRAIEAYMAADKPSEAVFVAEKLAEDAPGLMRAHEIHGRALVALAMRPDLPTEDRAAVFARAADAYMRAAALAPTNGPLQHATGVVCDTAGRHADAVRAYEAAHADEPGNAQFALYLGMARARDGRMDDARALIEEAERAMPESSDPKAALADLAMRSGDTARARAKIAEARALSPTSNELRVADARMRRMSGAPGESLELLLALDAPLRRESACAEEIAAAYTAMGKLREAAATLDESASARPNDWKRALRAAAAWMRAGDPVKATIAAEAAGLAGAPPSEVREALSGASGPRPGGTPSP